MQTVETVARHGTATAHEPRGPVRHRVHATVRSAGLLVALTAAFGLLGLLVGAWHLTRGRRTGELACRGCRRRRGRALAGTLVLTGLVVVGSGMAVDQHVRSPGLPSCDDGLPERTTADLDDPPAGEVGAVWLRAREALNAPVSGLARQYVDDRGGGVCRGGSMTVALLPSAASESTVAVGSVVLTGGQSSMREADGKALARHESRHVSQWATLTLVGGPLAMPILYVVDEAFFPDSRNHFERAAGLDDGGYPYPHDFGPRPGWAKIGVIGILLVTVGRRRLRWASRVLTGGATAAVASHSGLCPLHSRGWFRLQAAPSASGDRPHPRATTSAKRCR